MLGRGVKYWHPRMSRVDAVDERFFQCIDGEPVAELAKRRRSWMRAAAIRPNRVTTRAIFNDQSPPVINARGFLRRRLRPGNGCCTSKP